MISTPLRMEKPVRRPIVPPIKPSWASVVTLGKSKVLIRRNKKVHHFQLWCFVDLDVPFNLIIGGRVEKDEHLLQLSVLNHHS